MDLNGFVNTFEKSPWVLAIMIIIANIGFSQIKDELDTKIIDFLNGPITRRLILFALIFSGTRSLKVSLLSTLAYMIFVYFF